MKPVFCSFRPLRLWVTRPLRIAPRRCRLRPRSSPEDGSMPYKFDQQELQELLEMMPPPLDGEALPNSDIKFKRLMDKYGLRTDAIFGVDFEQRVQEQEKRLEDQPDLTPAWLQDPIWEETPMDEEEAAEDNSKEELTKDAKEFAEWIDFGYECMRERELEDIFNKAMELNHSQRARARNIYAACLWYSEKLKEAENEDYFEGHKESPVPAFIRAFFTLEEEFDELNAKQYEVDLMKQERTREIMDAEFREFMRTKVINMPTKPGSELERIFESFEKEKMDKIKQLKEPDNIDYLLKGILPHVDEDIEISDPVGKAKEMDIEEMLFKDVNQQG